MPDKTPMQIYREAADLIEKDGWVQGAYRSPLGCWCLSGAVAKAAGAYVGQFGISVPRTKSGVVDQSFEGFFAELADLESGLLSHVAAGVIEWNDVPGRTAEEVITLLRDRADLMEAEHG